MASMRLNSPVSNSGPGRDAAVSGTLPASCTLLGVIARSASPENRRGPIVGLTEGNAGVYNAVTGKRSREISRVLESLSGPDLEAVRIEVFARAAGEPSADETLILGI